MRRAILLALLVPATLAFPQAAPSTGPAPATAALTIPALPEVRLSFLGDAGTGDRHQMAIRDQMLKVKQSYVFLVGDNVYPSGSKRMFEEVYDRVYAPLWRRGVVFHAALGNHDVKKCDANVMNPLPPDFHAYMSLESRCDVEDHLSHASFGYVGGRRYYSVAIPPGPGPAPLVQVFVLDSNTLKTSQSKLLLRQDTAQLEWLDTELAQSAARWKIVIMHHPIHSPPVPLRYFFFVPIGGGRAREVLLDAQLTPILTRHKVDAVISGHNHFYARMTPRDGIRWFVSGGGGRKVYDFEGDPSYIAAGGGYYHFLNVRLTHDRFEYYAIDEQGVSRDAGWWSQGDGVDHPFPKGTLPP